MDSSRINKRAAANIHLYVALLAAAWVAVVCCGCHSTSFTTPPRSATEQLLMSQATEMAMRGVDLSWVNGRKIYIDESYFDSYDRGQALGVIRESLSRAGGLIFSDAEKADLIVEIRSGGLSINSNSTLIGIPSLAIPVPFSGPIPTPEIALYKSDKADSYAKFSLFAYSRDTGQYLDSSGPNSGMAHLHLYKIIFISWQKTDLPELLRKSSAKQMPKSGH